MWHGRKKHKIRTITLWSFVLQMKREREREDKNGRVPSFSLAKRFAGPTCHHLRKVPSPVEFWVSKSKDASNFTTPKYLKIGCKSLQLYNKQWRKTCQEELYFCLQKGAKWERGCSPGRPQEPRPLPFSMRSYSSSVHQNEFNLTQPWVVWFLW